MDPFLYQHSSEKNFSGKKIILRCAPAKYVDCLDFMEIGNEIICFCYGSTAIIPYACRNFMTEFKVFLTHGL